MSLILVILHSSPTQTGTGENLNRNSEMFCKKNCLKLICMSKLKGIVCVYNKNKKRFVKHHHRFRYSMSRKNKNDDI